MPALGNKGGYLGAKTARTCRFVDDDAAPGLGDRGEQCLLVIGLERREIDHLRGDALGGKLVGSRQGFLDHCPPADQRHVPPLLQDERDIQRQGLAIVLDLTLRGSVEARRFQENHRIGIADCRQQETVSALRRGRDDDTQAWDVREHGLGRFRMMLGRADAGTVRSAQDHRTGEPSLRPVAKP